MRLRNIILTVCVSMLAAAAPVMAVQEGDHPTVVGEWNMVTQFQGQEIPATMRISVEDDKLVGVWISQGGEMELTDLTLEGDKLTFSRTMGRGGQALEFEGTVEGDEIKGEYASPMGGALVCTGTRAET